jgi:hypothetical protein
MYWAVVSSPPHLTTREVCIVGGVRRILGAPLGQEADNLILGRGGRHSWRNLAKACYQRQDLAAILGAELADYCV